MVAGLVFVGVEIKQNTAAVSSSTIQSISEQSAMGSILQIENEDLRAAFLAMGEEEPLSDDQLYLLSSYYFYLMRLWQNRFLFLQADLGVVDQETLVNMGARSGVYSGPFFSTFWDANRDQFPEDFVARMEEEFEVLR